MALITKQVKVSNKTEKMIADRLGVDKALFKRLKFVNPNVMRFTFFLVDDSEMVGTLNHFWDVRKINHLIFLKRFIDDKVIKVRHLNDSRVSKFFAGA